MTENRGKGFNHGNLPAGVGLISMKERAKSAGGEVSITSKPGVGTKVIAEIPH